MLSCGKYPLMSGLLRMNKYAPHPSPCVPVARPINSFIPNQEKLNSSYFLRPVCGFNSPDSDFLAYFLLWPLMMRMKTSSRMKMRPTRATTTRNHHSS